MFIVFANFALSNVNQAKIKSTVKKLLGDSFNPRNIFTNIFLFNLKNSDTLHFRSTHSKKVKKNANHSKTWWKVCKHCDKNMKRKAKMWQCLKKGEVMSEDRAEGRKGRAEGTEGRGGPRSRRAEGRVSWGDGELRRRRAEARLREGTEGRGVPRERRAEAREIWGK
jgi:hypothetical protein